MGPTPNAAKVPSPPYGAWQNGRTLFIAIPAPQARSVTMKNLISTKNFKSIKAYAKNGQVDIKEHPVMQWRS